jgi:hypothetical protein
MKWLLLWAVVVFWILYGWWRIRRNAYPGENGLWHDGRRCACGSEIVVEVTASAWEGMTICQGCGKEEPSFKAPENPHIRG